MLIAHLKRFVFAFQETILKRVVHEAKHGTYAPAMALASYVPIMIAADTLKGIAMEGGDEPEWKRDWTAADYVGYGVQRAGLFGVGQFAVDAASNPWSVAGPSIEQLLVDPVRVAMGRERFGNYAVDALPAHAVVETAAKL
jgi:hypothetical protein